MCIIIYSGNLHTHIHHITTGTPKIKRNFPKVQLPVCKLKIIIDIFFNSYILYIQFLNFCLMSVFLRILASDCPLGIFNLFYVAYLA